MLTAMGGADGSRRCGSSPPGVHTVGSSQEFVLHVAIPLQSWIRLPPFFASIIPQEEPLELWLQHAGCSTLATEAEVAVVAPGEVFMTRGWREIARVCRVRGVFRSTWITMVLRRSEEHTSELQSHA